MDVVTTLLVTGADQFIGWGTGLSVAAIFGLVAVGVAAVVSARRDRREHAVMDSAAAVLRERWGGAIAMASRLRPVEPVRRVVRDEEAPVRHRARREPTWFQWGARRGAVKPDPGYGPPPPLPSKPVSPPPSWPVADLNTVRWPGNPVRASVPVGFADPWEEISVTRDVLAGDMRAAADFEDTGLIEPIRAEVVQ